MKKLFLLLIPLTVAACSPPPPTDTVESLVANPERLKQLREQCEADRAKLGDVLCTVVAEAIRRRFMGDGKVPYTPPKESPKF